MITRLPDLRTLQRELRSRRPVLRALGGTISAGVAIQLTLVVTGIVLARGLGPENRGHLALLTLIAAILWNLGPLGIPAAVTYAVARVPERTVDIIREVRRTVAIQLVAATCIAGILLFALTVDRPGYVEVGALVALVTVPFVILQQLGLSVLAGLRRFVPYNLLRVGPNAVFAVLATALLVTGAAGFIELTLAWGVSRVVFVPMTLRNAWRHSNLVQTGEGEAPSGSWLRRFGRRSFIGEGPILETYRVDQAVVALFLTPVALGFYVVALAFTNLPRFIARSVGQVASPTVASRRTRDHARRTMWRFFWIAIPLYLPVVAGIMVFAPELTRFFFGEEFAEAAQITQLLLIATALYCARRVLTDASRGAGYPGLGTIAEIVALVSVIPLFAVFVPLWDTKGVAAALIASSAIALAVLLVGLLRPGARRAEPGPGWFETAPSPEVDAAASPEEKRRATAEPASGSA